MLPLALTGFIAVTLLFFFLVKASGLLLQRERASMRTDVTALSIGVDYARALNVLSASNKIVGTGHIATFVPIIGPEARKVVEATQKAQNFMLKYGPWLNEASAMHLGAQNGLVAVPIWNTPDLLKDFNQDSFTPAYRVRVIGVFEKIAESLSSWLKLDIKQETVAKAVRKSERAAKEWGDGAVLKKIGNLAKKQLPSLDLSWLLERAGYSFKPKNGGPRVYVPEEGGHDQVERKAGGGTIVRSHEDEKNRFVHVEQQIAGDLPFMLKDLEHHHITLIAPFVPALDPQAQPGQPWLWSVAQVQVIGGNMDYWNIESIEYRPYFEPVGLHVHVPGTGQWNRQRWSATGKGDRKKEDVTKGHDYAFDADAIRSEVTYQLGRLPMDLSRLPGASAVRNAFNIVLDVLDIQH